MAAHCQGEVVDVEQSGSVAALSLGPAFMPRAGSDHPWLYLGAEKATKCMRKMWFGKVIILWYGIV